eukprot:TRINITY_DN5750_c0_g1_i2.p1 TRINITY_DN5750_c0_g1~~TRINITY_DN5750_c0_g1_i2.p1  ORF type:complete len:146 (-),score=32.12 TRINITY_DN5750_c0_g1_i2:85-522(-)
MNRIVKAQLVNGKWTRKVKKEDVVKVKEIKSVTIPKLTDHVLAHTKVAKTAKANHNPEVAFKKQSKIPENLLKNKRDELSARLQDKKGFGWFRPTWQEQLALDRRRQKMRKYSLNTVITSPAQAAEIARYKMMQLVTRKPSDFIN